MISVVFDYQFRTLLLEKKPAKVSSANDVKQFWLVTLLSTVVSKTIDPLILRPWRHLWATLFVVNGRWSSWSAWSACSATCGDGKRVSKRFCDAPPPRHGGRPCRGEHEKTESCMEEECTGQFLLSTFWGRIFSQSECQLFTNLLQLLQWVIWKKYLELLLQIKYIWSIFKCRYITYETCLT